MLTNPTNINIVLSANQAYTDYLITTIKSVCYHNRNIKFFILNRDFPSEWFYVLNCKLAKLNSSVIDIKITNESIKNFKTYQHISSDTTYFRYFIPELIPEDKVLYLDCDLIITGCLKQLYSVNLENDFLAAVKDDIAQKAYNNYSFNAGVLLINNRLWKENNITKLALELSEKYVEHLPDADQSILNIIFENKWLKLNRGYNYLVGVDFLYPQLGLTHLLENFPAHITPLILHFNTEAKPWLIHYKTRFRDTYWFYYSLEWQDIYQAYT
ncbi:glycosyltransferase family 8 protein [Actinobacillus equuli]|uniref:glycosyltransferase family 8 protein n=1 Tax=Actinobacillus equuli TaxID=718 RepID=UPI002442CF55|nr:glycosyltransferase family 8 protein [Actinobacillus equuli]WGE86336.1 glycosyltransferase family 8 protein [Actinobacillus equuli subsp. haemolyticus]